MLVTEENEKRIYESNYGARLSFAKKDLLKRVLENGEEEVIEEIIELMKDKTFCVLARVDDSLGPIVRAKPSILIPLMEAALKINHDAEENKIKIAEQFKKYLIEGNMVEATYMVQTAFYGIRYGWRQ
ncbi:MAG: hypothetical protein Q8P53_03205 [Candidatus Shapirobacteria bacterium]|nr:hypothetical protein [Candidatus Shapirobacteria bacterium]